MRYRVKNRKFEGVLDSKDGVLVDGSFGFEWLIGKPVTCLLEWCAKYGMEWEVSADPPIDNHTKSGKIFS